MKEMPTNFVPRRGPQQLLHRSLLIAALAATFFTISAKGTVLLYDITGAGVGDDFAIPSDYGNHVLSGSVGSGGLTFGYGNFGEGFTPNVSAQYVQPAAFFSNGFGAMVNVAYAPNGNFILRLTADPGFSVSLYSFDLAGLDSSYQISSVSVLSGAVTLFSQLNVVVNGSSNGTGLTSFTFGAPLTASELLIEFDATNLGPGAEANVGIDNIRFGQDAIPEPSITALGILAAGLAFVLRRHRSA